MSCVWKATQLTLDRPVAIKFLYSYGPGQDAQRERFLREARIAASVAHRNVVDILDFGMSEEYQPYMVMSLLEGETLGERLDRSPPLEIGELVRIVAMALRGLSAVHAAGITHRDLKPENIFLVNAPDGAYPKLLDFGISRAATQREGRRSPLTTREGVVVGTPQYMSPEQARGLRNIDWRTDIYSMGVILYEALTGSLPFDSENIGDLIVMILSDEPRSVRAWRPELGSELSAVVSRAMARDPAARFGSAMEMLEALLDAAETSQGRPVQQSLSVLPRPRRSLFPPQLELPSARPAQRSPRPRVAAQPSTSGTNMLWAVPPPPRAPVHAAPPPASKAPAHAAASASAVTQELEGPEATQLGFKTVRATGKRTGVLMAARRLDRFATCDDRAGRSQATDPRWGHAEPQPRQRVTSAIVDAKAWFRRIAYEIVPRARQAAAWLQAEPRRITTAAVLLLGTLLAATASPPETKQSASDVEAKASETSAHPGRAAEARPPEPSPPDHAASNDGRVTVAGKTKAELAASSDVEKAAPEATPPKGEHDSAEPGSEVDRSTEQTKAEKARADQQRRRALQQRRARQRRLQRRAAARRRARAEKRARAAKEDQDGTSLLRDLDY